MLGGDGRRVGQAKAPFLGELVPVLRSFGELDLDDATAVLPCRMSAATIDRRFAPDRAKLAVRGRSHTKPGGDAIGGVEQNLITIQGQIDANRALSSSLSYDA